MIGPTIYGEDSFITLKEDTDLYEDSIIRILLTTPGERACNPLFGCKLKNYLFDLSAMMLEESKADIYNAITKWEPRVTVDNITMDIFDVNTVGIKIDCTVKDTLEEFSVERVLQI